MKRILTLMLALLLAGMTLVACGTDAPDVAPNQPDQTDPAVDPETTEDPADARIPLDLPARYYGRTNGEKEPFHIVEWSVDGARDAGAGWIPWHEGDANEEEGDLMSNAIFARNAYVEETYGIDITQEYADVNQNKHFLRLQQDNQTGEGGIQLVTTRALHAWSFASSGLLHDMADVGEGLLHFDQPWWVQDAVKSYALGDSLYICSTEMLLRDKGATAAMYFNPKIAENHQLGNFYEFVETGDWTVEMMISACEIVATSLDGDDLLNSGRDQWGILSNDDTSYYLFAAMDQKFGIINDDGYLEMTFGTADGITTMQDIFEDIMYADWYHNSYLHQFTEENAGFENDRGLFMSALIKTAYVRLRDMETPYGVLPMPMADTSQEDHRSLVWVHHDSVLGIPSATFDQEMACIILEALSYEGYYSVTPVLLDTLIYGRLAKTEEARNSFERIFNTRVYDAGQYWGYTADGLVDGGRSVLRHTKTGNSNMVSVWETH